MNRTFALSRKTAFSLPIRPRPSPLPTNLSRPHPSNQLTIAQALFPQLRNSGVRFYATTDHPGGKGPSPGPDPKTVKDSNREDQNATPGVRQELKGMTKDFASLIAGSSPQAQGLGAREVSAHGVSHGSITDDFLSVTKGMFTSVPKPVLYTGLAGTIPYLGTSLSIVALAREASLAAAGESPAGLDLATCLSYLHTMEHIQITYGAIILSFLGALHWGMEFAKLGGVQGYQRLFVGIAPVLAAWPTLLMPHGLALATQWFGFTGMWFLDQRATIAGWTTYWYSTYRFYLSIIVGFSIIGTLVGTSIYGAGAGATEDVKSPHLRHTHDRTSALKRLDKVKEKNYPSQSSTAKVNRVEGKVGGPIQVEEEGSGEGYLKLRNIEREEQEKKEAEEKAQKEKEEKEQKKKEQDEKENKQKEDAPGDMKSGSKDRQAGESEKDQGKKKAEEQGATEQKGGAKEQDKEGDEKKDDGKNEEEGKDEGEEKEGGESKDNQGGDNKDDKQEQAAKEKGAAGDKNTKMK
ncbi:hypothetical protein I302_107487 [Kwoniella bestiolae CBS 10118]|uniref:Uncharacterized protein n=1 Tax=Kwoniella bestiolae CBS 10118 TaxID=1296100 RepID=A0A1B9FYD1_9TREE|nr:hypothetical protein I302_06772 [Kwoniella bestiolae CBS 10118]OCF23788.1 hypothetical protein I302_06772 [Kwoniella bestiolae CBS 10118]